jgi:hypothetical protein
MANDAWNAFISIAAFMCFFAADGHFYLGEHIDLYRLLHRKGFKKDVHRPIAAEITDDAATASQATDRSFELPLRSSFLQFTFFPKLRIILQN